MPLTTDDDLVTGMGRARFIPFQKFGSAATIPTGRFGSAWLSGGLPIAGAIPTIPATPVNTTPGALPLPTPGGGEKLYLNLVDYLCVSRCDLFIYDRLAHMGGLSGTVTTAQTVNLDIATAAAAGRCNANGANVEWFYDWYVSTGGTTATITTSYTNQDGTSGRSSVTPTALAFVVAQCERIPYTGSDFAIRSVQTAQLSISTGTAGNFGVTARRRLATIPSIMTTQGVKVGNFRLGFAEVHPNACLEFMVFTRTAGVFGLAGSGVQIISI